MPTFTQTAKYALRWLTGSNLVNDIDAGFQALAEDVDSKMAGYSEGPLGSRPPSTSGSPGKAGRIYRAADTGQAFLDTGTSWVEFTLGGAPVSVPVATVLAFGGPTGSTPVGYLPCDGTAVDRTVYAALFAIIGSAHGNGNGSTTFNVPDLRGRVPVGVDGSAGRLSVNDALGQSGGEEKHTLTAAESGVAAHGHGHTLGINAGGDHSHGGSTPGYNFVVANGIVDNIDRPTTSTLGGFREPFLSTGTAFGVNGQTGVSGSHTHGIGGAISNAGAASAANGHNNMMPFATVNYVIKT